MLTDATAATFDATRRELLGSDALLGAAEVARGICGSARRHVSLLAITHERMRRIDGWLNDDGFVFHPVAATPDRQAIGTVCSREHGVDVVGSIVQALVGPIPNAPGADHVDVGAIGVLTSSALPTEVAWLLVVTATSAQGADRWASAAVGDGLVGASVPDPTWATRLEPVGPVPMWTRIARLVDGASEPSAISTSPSRPPGGAPS